MGTISKNTYRRLFLLYLIGRFKDGVWGATRLNKVVYFSTKELKYVPFEFQKSNFGQFSEQLRDENDLLLSMGHLSISRFETDEGNRGNRYYLSDPRVLGFYQVPISHILKNDLTKVDQAVDEMGYLQWPKLLERAYEDPTLQKASEGEIILRERLPDEFKVNLSEDDCEDLELSLNPDFIQAMTLIDRGLERSRIDLDKVKKVVKLI